MALDKSKIDALKIDPSQRVRRGGGAGVWVLAVAVAGMALAGWWLLSREPLTLVQTERVGYAATASEESAVLNASGYVVARRLATVSSKVTGKIETVHVEEGLEVAAGDVLATLDGATARAQLALVRSQLDSARTGHAEIEVRLAEAKRNLDRNLSLRDRNLVSAATLDASQSEVNALNARLVSSRSNVTVAERQVELAEQSIDDLIIRAPFDGVVITKNAQPGEMISPMSSGGFTRTGICTIVDMTSREIEVDVNESYINRVSSGQPVEARLDAYPGWEIPARVINIVPAADRQKATVRVRIGFAELDPRILPDMGVKVAFLSEAPEQDSEPEYRVLGVVSSSAVTDIDGKKYVWVVDDQTLERRAVTLGSDRGGRVEVIAGVRANEVVVAAPGAGLVAGQEVQIQN